MSGNSKERLEQENVVPLYVQLKEIIKKDVESGKFKPGQKIPTEFELCEMYSISRNTVRAAINELIEEGLLSRKQGKGTFISSRKIEREIGPTLGFTKICELNHLTPSSKVIEQTMITATPLLAEMLKVPVQSSLVSIKRVMMADQVPVILDQSVFPAKFFPLLQENLENKSLYSLITDQFDITLHSGRKSFQIVFADAHQAKYLQVKKGYPLMHVEGVVHSSSNEIVHYGENFIVGDKFKFYI